MKIPAKMPHFLEEIERRVASQAIRAQTNGNSDGTKSVQLERRTSEILVAFRTMDHSDIPRVGRQEFVIGVRQAIHVRQNAASRHRMIAEEPRHRGDAANIVHATAQFPKKIMQRTRGPHKHLEFFLCFGQMRRPGHRIFVAAEPCQFVKSR